MVQKKVQFIKLFLEKDSLFAELFHVWGTSSLIQSWRSNEFPHWHQTYSYSSNLWGGLRFLVKNIDDKLWTIRENIPAKILIRWLLQSYKICPLLPKGSKLIPQEKVNDFFPFLIVQVNKESAEQASVRLLYDFVSKKCEGLTSVSPNDGWKLTWGPGNCPKAFLKNAQIAAS